MKEATQLLEEGGLRLNLTLLTHELWYPVSTLRALALSLTQSWDDLDDKTRLELAKRIERETKRLRDLAEQTETVGLMEAGGFSITTRPEYAIELIREATDAVDELGGRLRVDVAPGADDLLVLADRGRVLQVLRNLLSNAEKYGMAQTPIELRLHRAGESAAFTVANQGSGIASEESWRLFQPFSRIARETSGADGMGLGLYISRRLVQAHGGRIDAHSEGGETAFTFTLPLTVDAV
jgi:signal transduction histidine kinase